MVADIIQPVMGAIMPEAEAALHTKADITKIHTVTIDTVFIKRGENVKKANMTFKAKIATSQVLQSNQGGFRTYTSPYYYEFGKTKIKFPKEITDKTQTLLRPENIIYDNDRYTLIELSKEDNERTKDSKFQAKFSNGLTVNLVMNNYNFWKLKLIHKKTWIQKNSDFLIKESIKALIAGSIGFLIGLKGCK